MNRYAEAQAAIDRIRARQGTLPRCPRHPTQRPDRRPRDNCEHCWRCYYLTKEAG